MLVCGLTAAWATGGLKARTANGWLVFENLPEQADVLVDGENVTVQLKGGKTPFEFSVTAGIHRVLVKKDGVEVAGEEVSIRTGERTPFRVRFQPLVASEPKKTSSADVEHSPRLEAPKPKSDATAPVPIFREIASIKTPDPVIQARLLPAARHVPL